MQDSSVEHKFEDAQARMSERIRQVSKFSRGRKFCFNRLLHTDVCLLWKTQRIKITFNNNIFKIENKDFTSGNKKKADDEFSLPEIRGIPSKKTNQECYLVSIMTAAGTGDFVIGIFTTGSEPQ